MRLFQPLLLLLLLCTQGIAAQPLATISDEDLLLLELRMDGYTLTDALTAFSAGEQVLVSLPELAAQLEFTMEFELERGRAQGWFVDESRTFRLSVDDDAIRVEVDGVPATAPRQAVRFHGNSMLVDYRQLSQWLPVKLELDMPNLRLTALAREPLPVQQKIQRLSRKPRELPMAYRPQMPRQEVPYALLAAPHADITLSNSVSRWDNTGEVDQYSRYTIMARGDFAYMNSQLYLGGNQNDALQQARLFLERGDPDGELLGPLAATRVQVGDLSLPSFPLLGLNTQERGISIERSRLGRQYDFDRVDIQGDIEPDWEVELYWNGNLIDRQFVTTQGRYNFAEVPLYYGNNEFTLRMYGPDGQQREEQRRYFIGPGVMRSGYVDYQLSYSEKGEDLFAIDDGTLPPTNQGTPRMTGRFSLGLGRGFSLGAGLHSVEFDDVRHQYTNYELRGLLPGSSITLRSLQDSEGGSGYEGVLQSSWSGATLRGHYFHNDGMLLESELNSADRRISEAEAVVGWRWRRAPIQLRYRDTRRDLSSSRELSNYFTVPLAQAFLSNSLTWQETSSSSGDDEFLTGSLQLTTRRQPLQWRVRANYALLPDTEMLELYLGSTLRIDSRMRMNFELTHSNATDFSRYRAGLSWELDEALVTPSIAYDSNENYFGYLNISFGIGPNGRGDGVRMSNRRLSAYGAVAADIFVDENADGLHDSADSPVEGVVLRAMPGYKKAQSDGQGRLLLEGLEPYRPVDMLVERGSIGEPMLLPRQSGIGLVPRPGRLVRLQFPLQRSSEIEGTLYVQDERGKTALPGVEVWLEDAAGDEVQRVRSAYDGFYLFSDLLPGSYRLRLPERYRFADAAATVALQVGSGGEILSGNDLLLRDTAPDREGVELEQPTQLAPLPLLVDTKASESSDDSGAGGKAGRSHAIQFGAYRNQGMAEEDIARLQRRYPDLLSGLKIRLLETDIAGKGLFFRILAQELSKDKALQLCSELKRRGESCLLIPNP